MKHTKKLLCLLLALVMSLSLSACAGSSSNDANSDATAAVDHDREVVFGSASMITNFNMKYITSANDIQAADQVYDTLVRKVNGEFRNQLAKSWEISEDGLTYTFHIQPDAKLSLIHI